MSDNASLKPLAEGLAKRIIDVASSEDEMKDIDFIFGISYQDFGFTIKISCGDYLYEVPAINLAKQFLMPGVLEQMDEFVASYGRFLAYDYKQRIQANQS